MAKLSYSSLKLKVNDSVKEVAYGDHKIEVLQYLPIEDKYDLIMVTLQKSFDEVIYNPLKLDMYFHLHLVYMYTNISFTDKQRENEEKLYDALNSNGIFDLVLENIPEDEYETLFSYLAEVAEEDSNFKNSLVGIIHSFIREIPVQASKLTDLLGSIDMEQYQNIMNMIKTLNNGKSL